LRYTRVEVRKVGGVAHSLAWLTRLPTMLTVIYAAKLEQVVENVQCKDTRTAQTSSFYNLTSPTRYRHAELPTDGDAT
jgi:hypothetical protein